MFIAYYSYRLEDPGEQDLNEISGFAILINMHRLVNADTVGLPLYFFASFFTRKGSLSQG